MEKSYFKGIEELENDPAFVAQSQKEFATELPVLNAIVEPISTKGTTSRRDFLKMLGFSTTAAVIAASCEMPLRKSIPYALKPEELVPGVANYYASVFNQGGEVAPVLVKTREGRPIKIDGNKMSVLGANGGSNARVQASVLSLYDGARYTGPMRGKEHITWEKADEEIGAKLKSIKASGGKIVLFSSSIVSPATQSVIDDFAAVYGVEHIVNDAVSYSGILDANEKSFGQRTIPSYHFDKATVIVGLGCDFLGSWLSAEEFAADWAKNRKLNKGKKNMSRHIQIESALTITGSCADRRIPVKPSEEALAAADLMKAVSGGSVSNPKLKKVADDLIAAKGTSLVVSGSNDVNVQLCVNAINEALGNYGNTISFDSSYNTKKGNDKAALALADRIGNDVKAVLVYNSNPLLTLPNADKLEAVFKKAELTVSFSDRKDETSEACQYVCPDNHWLESWNDASPKTGVYNIGQPTINRLFDTRQAQDTMLKWAGHEGDFYSYLRESWRKNIYPKQSNTVGFDGFWDIAVHDGEVVIGGNNSASFNSSSVSSAAEAVTSTYSGMGDVQLKLYESTNIGNGFWADNPYLQENPDAITKVTWDNVVMVPVSWYKANKGKVTNDLELKDYTLLKISANGHSIELPAVAVPGQADGTFAIAVGYGRKVTNHEELKVGANAYPLMGMMGDNASFISKATVEILPKTQKLAITQTHHNITLDSLGGVKRRGVVKETTLPEYLKNPAAGNEDREKIKEELVTLYYEHEKKGHHWTMTIDLNSCTGCGACVTACNIENNIPVVGKDQVIRSREMHWLRIDRYFTYSEMIQDGADTLAPEKLDVVFQPMLCQHCDNAPCENVCPVAATTHSSEGLNQMTYNRCIGTRYCANNCPYKVRRFNWYDYQGADAFDKRVGSIWANEGLLSGITQQLQEPMTRLVLNPDVTVRSRGVIEKCSFCVQRLQDAKLTAKKDNRPLKDGEATTACQVACSTGAIVFGDRNNKESEVFAEMNNERAFGVIEEIHTMPNVLYLTKVRNREENAKA
ncbi:MAG: TAT-variant-translocated molybdopterin oxidoreductase [Chitinophagales bacterium]